MVKPRSETLNVSVDGFFIFLPNTYLISKLFDVSSTWFCIGICKGLLDLRSCGSSGNKRLEVGGDCTNKRTEDETILALPQTVSVVLSGYTLCDCVLLWDEERAVNMAC